ncbi:YbjQ family protein [candidate division KSB1 bacterium]|nr:YbjQ family protein [candidate division KSB1 bacterium]
MLLVTTPDVIGKEIYQTLGLVRGNTIRAKNVFRDIGAGLKSIVGGELKDYTKMMTDSREQAVERMTENAEKLGANAIVNVRFASSDIMSTASEILAYGTAVKLK